MKAGSRAIHGAFTPLLQRASRQHRKGEMKSETQIRAVGKDG